MKKTIIDIYGQSAESQRERYSKIAGEFAKLFPNVDISALRYFSAPGRTEISGNHTDHNHGKVLAAAVNLDAVCAASANDTGIITVYSKGYEAPFTVSVADIEMCEEEKNTTVSLIKGVCAGIKQAGGDVGGFDCYMESSVAVGSGLSSSAAVEVLVCTVLDCLYGGGNMQPVKRAQIAQFAENEYFGKPSGLMDQAVSSVGGLVKIDFGREEPVVEQIDADFVAKKFAIVVVGTGSSHDDLTHHYAAIPNEMKLVSGFFGKSVLREIGELEFLKAIPALKKVVPERAILRAMHFFAENRRVDKMVAALEEDCFSFFLREAIASGDSSWRLLQNVYAQGTDQSLALALAVSENLLKGCGAWRVHGGGFAGTIQAFVPDEKLDEYTSAMDGIFGEGACCVLSVREIGAAEVTL